MFKVFFSKPDNSVYPRTSGGGQGSEWQAPRLEIHEVSGHLSAKMSQFTHEGGNLGMILLEKSCASPLKP